MDHAFTDRSPSSHGTQQTIIDLDYLLDGLTGDPVPCGCSGVRRDDDTSLETESKRRRTMCKLYGAVRIGVIVCQGAEEGGRLKGC